MNAQPENYHSPKSEVSCPKCGKPMHKRNYWRAFDRTKSVYQWRCVWACNGVVFVDYQGYVCKKPVGKPV